ncbi:MAG TPA: tripartite tricarboxylate transporter TctB family protein [Dongiaceae bacterium]|jgi:putative tricarboxylic transport membrane protein
MRALKADAILAICVIAGALLYLWSDLHLPTNRIGDPLGPKAFPALVAGGLILSGLLLFLEIRKKRRAMTAGEAPAHAAAPVNRHQLIILGGMVAWTAIYYAVFEQLGYLLATPVFLFALLSYFHRGRHVVNVFIAIGFAGVVYALFSLLLGVPLPRGPLGF